MSRTLHFLVTVPEIPDNMTDESARAYIDHQIRHPEDAAFDADITVALMPEVKAPEYANPERVGNGCMIFQESAPGGE